MVLPIGVYFVDIVQLWSTYLWPNGLNGWYCAAEILKIWQRNFLSIPVIPNLEFWTFSGFLIYLFYPRLT